MLNFMSWSCISFSFNQEYFVMVSKIVLPVERFMFWTDETVQQLSKPHIEKVD